MTLYRISKWYKCPIQFFSEIYCCCIYLHGVATPVLSKELVRPLGTSVLEETHPMLFHSLQLPLETVHRISLYCILTQTVPSVDESFCEEMSSHIQICPVLIASMNSWPLSCLLVERSNIDSSGTPDRPLTILKTSIRSALLRRSSKLLSPNHVDYILMRWEDSIHCE